MVVGTSVISGREARYDSEAPADSYCYGKNVERAILCVHANMGKGNIKGNNKGYKNDNAGFISLVMRLIVGY